MLYTRQVALLKTLFEIGRNVQLHRAVAHYYPRHSLGCREETHEKPVTIAGLRAEI
jgi:hypothetical protein